MSDTLELSFWTKSELPSPPFTLTLLAEASEWVRYSLEVSAADRPESAEDVARLIVKTASIDEITVRGVMVKEQER
jgi:hypothetical protein